MYGSGAQSEARSYRMLKHFILCKSTFRRMRMYRSQRAIVVLKVSSSHNFTTTVIRGTVIHLHSYVRIHLDISIKQFLLKYHRTPESVSPLSVICDCVLQKVQLVLAKRWS